MPLDIDSQNLFQNAQFQQFVDFAEKAVAAGKHRAIARIDAGELGGIVNRTIKPGTGDWVGVGVGRLASLKRANNATRDAFLKAVSDMFGGESRIPASVKDAMKLEDYGKGKPLTARRILAVKAAIDGCGLREQKEFEKSISRFQNQPDMEAQALSKGYSRSELPRLASAVNLYAKATGCSEAEALEQVSTPGSKANRLMNYGGRFLQSVENFGNGLRLMDDFGAWFDGTRQVIAEKGLGSFKPKYEEGMSKTLLNVRSPPFNSDSYKLGMEKFVFEELAFDSSIDLAETDVNKVFGMEYNAATSCVGRDFLDGKAQTFAQIPPEKRPLVFKALTVFVPLYASTVDEANVPPDERAVVKGSKVGVLTARILKNLDKVAELDLTGRMDIANLVKLCFPEIRWLGARAMDSLVNLFNQWDRDICGGVVDGELIDPKYPYDYTNAILENLQSAGCTPEEAFKAAETGQQLPNVPYFSPGSMNLGAFDGTTETARHELAGDLNRPNNYSFAVDEKKDLLKTPGFKFNFPGGETLVTDGTEKGLAAIQSVADRLDALCGKLHPRQATNLMMMVSQGGLAQLRGGLRPFGIVSNEHSAVDFTIDKNDATGDITVRYSSPAELPFAFEWTATIKPDGYVSSTPMRFTDAETLAKETADTLAAIKDSVKGIADKPERMALADTAAEMLVSRSRTDRDLMALLRMDGGRVANSLIIDGAQQVRPEAKIAERLESLRGSVNELRIAANGNKRIFDIGMNRLAEFGGNAPKTGMIAKMCELIAKEDLGWIGELGPSSPPEKICENVCRLDNLMVKIRSESKIMATFNEAFIDETTTANRMILGLILAHCGEKTLNGIKDAMSSANCKQMMAGLDKLENGQFPEGKNIKPEDRIALSDYASRFNMVALQNMFETVHEVMGRPVDNEALGKFAGHSVPDAGFQKMVDILEDSLLQSKALDVERLTNHERYEP